MITDSMSARVVSDIETIEIAYCTYIQTKR